MRFKDLVMLSLDSLPGMNPTCSGPMIFERRGFNLLAKIFNNLMSTFKSDIGLKFAVCVVFVLFGNYCYMCHKERVRFIIMFC